MALFQHALQLCAIAYISNAVQGHVLLAVNVEDFRNLANQFLSRTLAEKLTQLVSESAGTNRRDDTRTGQSSDIDLSKVAEIIRDKLVNGYESPVPSTKVTRKYNIKRFNTVKNTDEVTEGQTIDKEMMRNPNSQDDPEPVYVKDDLDKLLQMYNDGQSNEHRQFDYAGRSNESKEKFISQEPIYSKGSLDAMRNKHAANQSDTHKKIDYTETKLGEWLFNHIISQKPVKIQNHKNAIDINDINEEGNADEFPDKAENVRNVQYVYETHLSGAHDKSKQNVRHETLPPINKDTDNVNIQDQQIGEQSINEYIMGPKFNTFYKKKPLRQIEDNYTSSKYRDELNENYHLMDKQHIKRIQGNENTFNHESIPSDQVKVMPASLEETKIEPIKAEMETLYDAAEGKHRQIEEHIMFNKYILGLKDKEKPQRQPVGENNMSENYKQQHQQTKSRNQNRVDPQKVEDSDEKLIKKTKKIFSDENIAYNKDEIDESHNRDQSLLRDKKGDPDIKISKKHHYPSDYKEVKSDSVKSNTESSLGDTVEVKEQKGGKQTTSRKENYIHRKKPQRPLIEENDVYDKYALGSENKNNKQGKDKPQADDDYVFKKPIAGKHRFDHDVSNKKDDETFNKGQSILRSTKRGRSEVSKYGVFTSKAPMKEEKFDEDLLPDFQSAKLGSSSSDEINGKQVERDKLNTYSLGKDTYKEKSKKKPMEENDMYEKYSLGSKDSKGREVKKDDDNYRYKDTNLGKKHEGNHRFRDKDMENDMYEKDSLGSRDKNSKSREVKKDDDKYEYKDTNLGKKSEGNHRFRDKNMENDMYEKHSLGSRDKNSKGREVKKDDDMYGYKDTNLGKRNEGNHRDKDIENNMYEKHSLGSRDKNSKGREVKEDDVKYGYKDTNLGKKNEGIHRFRDKNMENDMYEKHSLGSRDKNSKGREIKKDDDMYGYKDTNLGKRNEGNHRDKDIENDMYEKHSLGSRDKNSKGREVKEDDVKYGYKDTNLGKKNEGNHRFRDKDMENDMYEKHSLGSRDKNSKGREVKKDNDMYRYKGTNLGKKNEGDHRVLNKYEENQTNEKYSLGSKDKNSNREGKKNDDNYAYKETVLGKKSKDHHLRDVNEENDMYEKHSAGSKNKNSQHREVKKKGEENDKYEQSSLGLRDKKNKDHHLRDEDEEHDMNDKQSQGSKDKNSKGRSVKKDYDKYGYKESVLGKKNEADHLRDKNEKNDMYDREGKKDDDRYGYKDIILGKKNKDHRGADKDEENDMYEKYSPGSKDKNSNKEIRKENDRYGHKKSVWGKKNEDKYEENDMYDKYPLGSKDKNIKDKEVNKDDYGYKETGLGKKRVDRGLNKDDSENNDELLLKNKNGHLLKDTKVKGPKNEEVPSAGYAGDPRPDFVEVKPESIKAKTESLLDSVEDKGKATKRYTMKGTDIPKREFYKLSSPNYLKDLPRVVDKYNFEEPLPELDRERDKVAYLKREPARVNKKLMLPVFERVK